MAPRSRSDAAQTSDSRRHAHHREMFANGKARVGSAVDSPNERDLPRGRAAPGSSTMAIASRASGESSSSVVAIRTKACRLPFRYGTGSFVLPVLTAEDLPTCHGGRDPHL